MEKFWDAVSSKLADRLAEAFVGPGAVFWIALLSTIYLADHKRVVDFLTPLERSPYPVFVGAAVLVGLLLTSFALDRTVLPTLKFLEGYWGGRLRRLFARPWIDRRKSFEMALAEMLSSVGGDADRLTSPDRDRFLSLDQRRSNISNNNSSVMPTRLGNIIRSAEETPYQKYGLDTVGTWIHLWFVVPDVVRDQITAARSTIDVGVRSVLCFVALPWPFGLYQLVTAVGFVAFRCCSAMQHIAGRARRR